MGSADPPDPYGLLGLQPGATEVEIRRAFRRLARQAHPDAGGDPGRFVTLRRALELLTDPVARARLDAARAQESPPDPSSPAGSSAGVPSSGRHQVDESLAGEAAPLRTRWPALEEAWRLDATALTPLGGGSVPGAGPGFVATGDTGGLAGRQGLVGAGAGPAVVGVDAAGGVVRWTAGLATAAVGAPLVLGDLVVVVSLDGVVHGLDGRTGRTRWERRLAVEPSWVVPCGDHVVVASSDTLTAVRVSGEVAWVVRPHGGVEAIAAAGPMVVLRTGAGAVVAVDPRTGGTRWWLRSAAPWGHPPTLAGSWLWLPDAVPGGGLAGRLVAIDPRTGGAVHTLHGPAAVRSLHEADGALVVRDVEGGLTLVRGGRPRWRMVVPTAPSAPAVVDGAVAVATADGVLRLLSARRGTELHQLGMATGAGEPGSLVFAAGLAVVIGADGGVIAHRAVTPAGGPVPR